MKKIISLALVCVLIFTFSVCASAEGAAFATSVQLENVRSVVQIDKYEQESEDDDYEGIEEFVPTIDSAELLDKDGNVIEVFDPDDFVITAYGSENIEDPTVKQILDDAMDDIKDGSAYVCIEDRPQHDLYKAVELFNVAARDEEDSGVLDGTGKKAVTMTFSVNVSIDEDIIVIYTLPGQDGIWRAVPDERVVVDVATRTVKVTMWDLGAVAILKRGGIKSIRQEIKEEEEEEEVPSALSPGGSLAPEVEDFDLKDEDGNDVDEIAQDDILVTPYAEKDECGTQIHDYLVDAYESLASGKAYDCLDEVENADEYVAVDLFDIFIPDGDTGSKIDLLDGTGNTVLKLKFKVNITEDDEIIVLFCCPEFNGEWQMVPQERVTLDPENGYITVEFWQLCPILFLRRTHEESSAGSSVEIITKTPTETENSDSAFLWVSAAIIAAGAGTGLAIALLKKKEN